jgi:hypothetical protein
VEQVKIVCEKQTPKKLCYHDQIAFGMLLGHRCAGPREVQSAQLPFTSPRTSPVTYLLIGSICHVAQSVVFTRWFGSVAS